MTEQGVAIEAQTPENNSQAIGGDAEQNILSPQQIQSEVNTEGPITIDTDAVNSVPDNLIEFSDIPDETRIFRAEGGKVFHIRPVNQMQIALIQDENKPKKPEIPMMVSMVHGIRQIIPADDNKGYLAKKDEYEQELKEHKLNSHIPLMEFCFTAGVEEVPNEEWVNQYSRFFPDPSLHKFHYVMSHLTPVESAEMLNKIIGINMPTEAGVAESENSFPVSSG